jgi:hypothetical protein
MQLDSVFDGDIVTIGCQIEGETVGGNNVWDLIEDKGGFVADAFVVTGYDGFVPGAKRCPGASPPNANTSPAPSPAPGKDPPITPGKSGQPVTITGGFAVRAQVQSLAEDVCGIQGACAISTYGGHHPSADRAVDILISDVYGQMASDGYVLGDAVADYALANMAKYRIWYVILKQRINYGNGWEPMEDRGSITQNHFDHVHVSFDE